jgi:hypothetical protein
MPNKRLLYAVFGCPVVQIKDPLNEPFDRILLFSKKSENHLKKTRK